MDRKKNRVTIRGRKLSTLPTPSNMPSSTRLLMVSFTLPASMAFLTRAPSACIPEANRSCKNGPIRKKVRKNTRPIMPMNRGRAVYLPVSRRSIFWLRRCSRLSRGWVTQASDTLSM